MDTPVKQVIILRKDLNMRKGKMVAQGAHASMAVFFNQLRESGDGCYEFGPGEGWNWDAVKTWIEGAFTKVTVGVNSEQELLDIERKAREAGIACSLIQDSGRTEFSGVPTYTAVAIGPDRADVIDPITGHLSLL